ncbi:protein 4.1b isoform X2 [Ctenopharyngodon idella]|uniref:protein 4.1b isoform X2 n=1 Tax=Ctenopharyngodon idella TaxID=7959 RepID=UPI00222E77D1|nr:protein 4.1b isoform X2 [Ctenopharyngodon idella]
MLQCRVNFLDDTHFVWELERNAVGQDLFSKVCEHLDLLEREYYGLVMWDSPSTRVWLDCAKEIRKQIRSPVAEFFFSVKFYPPDPSILAEDITRYLLCLQLRKDILIDRLPCPSDILALLGSYTVQSTLGDYDPNLHKNNYVSKIVLAPNQSEELEERVMELHSTYRFMSPAQADMLFLENAMGLPMYGVDLHPAKDVSGADVMLGVCSEGLIVYEDEIKTNVFHWPRVNKISHKRSTFLLKMRPFEDEPDGVISFSLANYRACKQLWKCSVEHHSFFRNRLQDTKAQRLLTLGSRFRYHGRTQSECLEASGNITRAPPRFTRYIIKRKENDEILDILKQPVRSEFDDWFLVYGPDKWRISTLDDVMLESQKLQEWKRHADDWCVLFDGSPFSVSGIQQPFQTKEQREDVDVVEGSDERLTDELVIKQSYKLQVVQEGSDVIEKEHPDFELKPLKETLREEVLEVNGERIQRVVITKQWTQEVNSLVESQVDVEKKVESMEMVERRVMVTEEKKLVSGDTFERLEIMEQRLEEVEAIERKLVEVEELRVGLQEVESLEQRLQQVEKEELQQAETDDWYILLDRRPLMLTPSPTGRVQEELQQSVYIPKPLKKDDDWYILFDVLPQTMEISRPLPDVSSSILEEYQAEEEKREVERKIQQELVPPEKPKTQTREEVIQSRVKTEEVQNEYKEQVTVDYGRPQTVVLEQRAAEPQTDEENDWFVVLDGFPKRSVPSVELYEETREDVIRSIVRTEQIKQQEQVTVDYGRPQTLILEQRTEQPQRDVKDDWFIIFDISPKGSVPLTPHLQSPTVDLYEEIREVIQSRVRTEEVQIKQPEQVTLIDGKPQQVILEQRAAQPQRDVKDDWFILFDVSPDESETLVYPQLQGTSVELYEETKVEVIESRVRTEEKVTEVMTVSTKEQIIVPEKKRTSIIQIPQFPVVPREIDDDWFQLFDKVPYEQKSFPSETRIVSVAPLEAEEKRTVERRKEEVQIKQEEQVTVNYRRPEPLTLEQKAAEPERDIEDDWFIIFDVSPKESVPSSPRLRGTSVGLYEETREEVIQSRVRTEEKVTEVMTVSTKEQIIVPEKKKTSIIQTPQFPVVPREVDDDWFPFFDKVPYEQKSFPSDVSGIDFEVREPTKDPRVQTVVEQQMRERRLITEEKRVVIDERRKRADIVPQRNPTGVQEVDDDWFELLDTTPSEKRSIPSVVTEERRIKEQEDRVRQQEMRVKEEEKTRLREQEKRKLELEVRRAQPSITLATEVQPQIEAEDDWYILFDVSPKETVFADVLKVDRRAEEEKRRREEERRKQIRVDERPKRPSVPVERPVQLQTEVEDDWFTLMGISRKDYFPALPRTPVISPVAPPKPRPQIPADQPLTSTPTAQPVSITKTHQERTKDTLNITLESEAETESVLMRRSQTWTKRIEGENIYVRHSILMLEDCDISQEMILKHNASINVLKRDFMEVKQDFGPTEWDRRLSSYSPTGKAQLPHANGEILVRMGLIEDDEKTVLFRQQETIYL